MRTPKLKDKIAYLIKEDPRFHSKSYFFLLEALDYSTEKFTPSSSGHVSCKNLLLGFTEYSIQKFGPMATTVLKEWGIKNSYNVGEIVFKLISVDVLGKQETDTLDDFKSHLDLHAALNAPFIPKSTKLPNQHDS